MHADAWDLVHRIVYVHEIERQCLHALNATHHLNSAIDRRRAAQEPEDQNLWQLEVFRALHSVLTHASNVSRIFWPDVPWKRAGETRRDYLVRISELDRVKRGEYLRGLFGLAANSPLKKRTLRNHLEHFDERLDAWRESHRQSFAIDIIGSENDFYGLDPESSFRWYDFTTQTFKFRGERFDIQELATAIHSVWVTARQLNDALMAERLQRPAAPGVE